MKDGTRVPEGKSGGNARSKVAFFFLLCLMPSSKCINDEGSVVHYS